MGLFPKHAMNATDAIGHEHDMEGAAALAMPANGGRTPTAQEINKTEACDPDLSFMVADPQGEPN